MGLSNMQKDDFKWYTENFDELYKKYGKTFVVISGKKVIGKRPIKNQMSKIQYFYLIILLQLFSKHYH